MTVTEQFELWKTQATDDKDIITELNGMDSVAIEDAFYRDLAFGTGGLRGVIGAGTNRMNIYTVAKASQGLANYIIERFPEKARRIAVSYDNRIKSDLFAKVASGVFAANGIEVYIYSELMPTPCLSFAVRRLHCCAGVMITASHNPAKYNGYKVYGSDGCQITTKAADEILIEIKKIDVFSGLKRGEFFDYLKAGAIHYIEDDVYTEFIENVKRQSCLGDTEVDKNASIIYTPLNGSGLKPVLRALKEFGYTNVRVVKEQEQPDGNFPTCPYPNPEIKEAMNLGIEYARKYDADLLLATDPDCDRCGIAVRDGEDYTLLSGNEVGLLMLDYICSRRIALGTMPEDPVFIKTIVTMDLAERIADYYGVQTINVLTGFKFIGEQIGYLEKKGKEDSYICGFEESCGYLTGSYVRDKDAVNAAFIICEMFAYYRSLGISLIDKLKNIYQQFGYCLNTLHSYEFEGSAGLEKMQQIMKRFRSGISCISNYKVLQLLDYSQGIEGLPKSDVLKFILEGGHSVVIRPSGTEPKIKVYSSLIEQNYDIAVETEKKIISDLKVMAIF